MKLSPTDIPGLLEVALTPRPDARGLFLKQFHRDLFAQQGVEVDVAEVYTTRSERGVLRGLHFQTPPHDHVKLVSALEGEVLDAVVDLRRGSPTFGQARTFILSAERSNLLAIPRGCAHGFLARTPATLLYLVSTPYAPEHDAGVLWSSAGIDWPLEGPPLLSERDQGFPSLAEYDSPFTLQPDAP